MSRPAGYEHSEKTKKKISLGRTGKHHDDDTKKKISLGRTGKHHDDDTKKKISSSLKNYKKIKKMMKII